MGAAESASLVVGFAASKVAYPREPHRLPGLRRGVIGTPLLTLVAIVIGAPQAKPLLASNKDRTGGVATRGVVWVKSRQWSLLESRGCKF
jgi:hypothetical protein